MNLNDILFSKSHIFVYEKNGFCYAGVSDILLKRLGAVKKVYLHKTAAHYEKGEIFGFLETDSSAFELFMPAAGRITAVNKRFKLTSAFLPQEIETVIKKNRLIKFFPDSFEESKSDLMNITDYMKYAENN